MKKEILLAFDFGGTKAAIAIADQSKKILIRKEIVSAGRDGKEILKEAIDVAQEMIQIADGQLTGIGISTIGVVSGDYVDLAPNIMGWEDINLQRNMRDVFGEVTIRMENDVKTATIAELRRGNLKNTSYGLYVNLGTGISAGYTIGDKVVRGANGAAGEIAYLLKNRNEEKGFKQEAAPFEAFSSGIGIAMRLKEKTGLFKQTKDWFSEYKKDSLVTDVIDEALQEIGAQVANLATAWNPEKVVIGGGMVRNKDIIFPIIKQYIDKFVPFVPSMKEARFSHDASLIGAIEMARKDYTP
ncbi:ROK family protein [Terrilactibacillus laevilacticus]|uniref:ROK family protein n=1 Tax=Terrilactibacillus laevilacticus TaxID=1380157 RepID=A0ABW5PV07_9BACI|nr:ROK family protein [Terrilactibacillus laevilacticus]